MISCESFNILAKNTERHMTMKVRISLQLISSESGLPCFALRGQGKRQGSLEFGTKIVNHEL